jgi:hypothetical protein
VWHRPMGGEELARHDPVQVLSCAEPRTRCRQSGHRRGSHFCVSTRTMSWSLHNRKLNDYAGFLTLETDATAFFQAAAQSPCYEVSLSRLSRSICAVSRLASAQPLSATSI